MLRLLSAAASYACFWCRFATFLRNTTTGASPATPPSPHVAVYRPHLTMFSFRFLSHHDHHLPFFSFFCLFLLVFRRRTLLFISLHSAASEMPLAPLVDDAGCHTAGDISLLSLFSAAMFHAAVTRYALPLHAYYAADAMPLPLPPCTPRMMPES